MSAAATGAVSAHAAETVFLDKATFLAAAGSTQTETFGSAATGAFASSGGVYNQSFDGFSVTGQNNGNFVGIATGATSDGGPNYSIPASFTGQNFLSWANDSTGGLISLTINFNEATTAFGFDWFNTDFSDQYTLTLEGGAPYSGPPFTVANFDATSGFFGLISDTPFTSATITNAFNGGYISDEGMDNFITNGRGSVNTGVPEPTTWAMMILGFALVGGAMRRQKETSVRFAF